MRFNASSLPRVKVHERLRVHSLAAARRVKEEGEENDLIDRICGDPSFRLKREDVEAVLEPSRFTGRSAQQVEEYLSSVVRPMLDENSGLLGERAQLSV